MTILKDYVEAVTGRAAYYKEAEDYYEGRVGETFASARLRQAMRSTGHMGQHNYLRVVVDAVLNRLEIANIVADSPQAQTIVDENWTRNELGLEANEIHRRALEYGDAYALVWPNEDGELEVSYSSPRNTALVYDPENPRKKLFAVKLWVEPDTTKPGSSRTRLNIYTADGISKWSAFGDSITEGTNWTNIGAEDNPFGEVPVFHFRTHRPFGRPEHFGGYGAQNDINKLLATHFYTIDYQGAPQRYALTMQETDAIVDFSDDDTERENIGALKSNPGSLWYLKGIHGVGQFQPADPKVFWDPINQLKNSLAALTDTPYHYLERGFAGIAGGQALRVSEAPLLKKVSDRQTSFAVTWREIFAFILRVEGVEAHLEVKWASIESFDALDEWDVMLKKINAGLSHRQALREAGYEENDIERIMAERAKEAQEGAYYQRKPEARVSTADNENFQNRNGLTEDAKVNGGRGENN
jgi:hypothetical protein